MKIDEAVKILRVYNAWRRAPAHYLECAMPAMGDPRKIGIAIDTVCDALSSDNWARAMCLADDADESAIYAKGHTTEGPQLVLYPEEIAADPYLENAIAHLVWRGIAHRLDADDEVQVVQFPD